MVFLFMQFTSLKIVYLFTDSQFVIPRAGLGSRAVSNAPRLEPETDTA